MFPGVHKDTDATFSVDVAGSARFDAAVIKAVRVQIARMPETSSASF
jgi:hypothetical protein